MKTTIIALLALAGVAGAESVDYTYYETLGLKDGLHTAFDFSKSTSSYGGLNLNTGFTVENGVANFGDQCNTPKNEALGTSAIGGTGGDFTITMDLVSLGECNNWDCLFVAYSSTSFGQGYNTSLALYLDNDQQLKWSSYNGQETTFGENASAKLSTGIYTSNQDGKTHADSQTITLVQDSTAKTLTLYVDGVSTATVSDWESASIEALRFGAGGINNDRDPMNNAQIDNLAIWNKALTANQVKSLIVPEPATATLSLLALAGLCARRRRA